MPFLPVVVVSKAATELLVVGTGSFEGAGRMVLVVATVTSALWTLENLMPFLSAVVLEGVKYGAGASRLSGKN